MKHIKIHNDITVLWDIVDPKKQPYDLTGKRLTLILRTGRYTHIEIDDFTIVGNRVCFVFEGKKQRHLGTYDIELIENAGRDGERSVDECNVFKLVRHTNQTGGEDSCAHIHTETIALSSVLNAGIKGDAGKSAYEVAVDNGFDGTEEEWLASLKGADGATPVITATATVTDEGAPGVDVSKSGTDKAPAFNFAFRGITSMYEPLKALISRSREAYIDTGIAPLNGLWRFEIEGNTKSNEAAVLADLYVDNSHRMGGVVYNRATPKYDCWWLGVGYSSNPISSNLDLEQPFILEQSRSGVKIKQNGRTFTISYLGDKTITLSDNATFHLFSSARADIQPTYSVIYSAKFFEEEASAPSAWFLPVRRRTDGMLGMLDAISGKFFFSAGSKNFEPIELEEDQITIYTNLLKQI